VLLKCLVEAFVPSGPVIIGLDDPLERRRGRKLSARAIYYEAARSSKACFQKTSGLRWRCVALLVPVRSRGPGLGLTVPDRPVSFGTVRPLRATASAAQAALWSGPGGFWAKCAGGCPSGRSSWWPTQVTPRGSRWPGAPGRPSPLP
jgi:hypothetical protein